MENTSVLQAWARQAASGVRFGPDRRLVERELLDHLEDRRDRLVSRGLSEEEAALEAVRHMGDPEQVRRELGRIHRPWLGWLWRLSQVAAAITVVAGLLAMLVGIPGWMRQLKQDDLHTYDLTETAGYRVAAVGAGTRTAQIGDYTLEVPRASLGQHAGGESSFFFVLRVTGSDPLARPHEDIGEWVYVTDSLGNTYHGLQTRATEQPVGVSCYAQRFGILWREYEGRARLYDYSSGQPTLVGTDDQFWVWFDNGESRVSIPVVWAEVAP